MLKDYLEEKVYLKQQNRFLRLFLFLMTIALMTSFYVTYFAIKHEKVILVPFGLSQTVSVSENNPDANYIEELVKYISYLAFNYTPETIDWQVAILLRHFSSDTYPTYKQTFYRLAQDVKTAGVSSSFVVTSIKVNPKTKKILVSGLFQQWTREKKFIVDEQRKYLIEYTFMYGKFLLKELKECKDQSCEV